MHTNENANLPSAAEQFRKGDRIIDIRELGKGNINDTYLMTCGMGRFQTSPRVVLQQLNTHVFKSPDLVMRNICIVTEHIRHRLQDMPCDAGRRWEVPAVLRTKDGQDHWVSADGSFWRAISYIEDVRSLDIIRDMEHAKEAGYALGMFHELLSDLPVEELADTIEGFHVTPRYLEHYNDVRAEHTAADSPEVEYCRKFIEERKGRVSVLEDAKKEGKILLRAIHGDPKINNILIDKSTEQAVSIIDLDTVKPGLVHYDIGDCLRSGCNMSGEDIEDWKRVRFDIDICRAVLSGYCSAAKRSLTKNDLEYMYDAIRLLPFELGIRFFTDHLEGNVYFKVKNEGHNLLRALVQFRLTESIESQEDSIREIIKGLM